MIVNDVSTNAPLRSVPRSVIVAVPVWLAVGVTVTVRLAPLPPKTMFPLGTKVGLDELPLIVRLVSAVSMSPTVNAIAAVAVFTAVL